jgi:hypothetical protein
MHLLKKLSVSRAPKVVSFKPPHNGPRISGRETFDLFPLGKAVREARQQEEDMKGFHCFPIRLRGNQSLWGFALQNFKGTESGSDAYGPTAPFTLGIVETFVSEPLPPADWKALPKACLLGGDYLLWRSEFQDRCLCEADRNRTPRSPLLLINWQGKANGEVCSKSWISPWNTIGR